MGVTPVRQLNPQAATDDRAAAFERRSEELELLRLQIQLGLQVGERRRPGLRKVLE